MEFIFHGSQVIKNKKLLLRIIGYLEIIFRGSQVIKNKKLLLRIIGYLEIIFREIQVDRVASALNTAADKDQSASICV